LTGLQRDALYVQKDSVEERKGRRQLYEISGYVATEQDAEIGEHEDRERKFQA
jgi:hypothetical protein